MNAFEIALVGGIICGGYLFGKALSGRFGALGWIGGSLIGFGLVGGMYYALRGLIDRWYRWRPLRPACKEGKCRADDYELLDISKERVVFRCRCGTKYARVHHRFVELLDDGSVRPYMKRRGFLRGWEKEEQGGAGVSPYFKL